MNEVLYVIRPAKVSDILMQMTAAACSNNQIITITEENPLPDLKYKRLLFAIDLNQAGYCIPIFEMLSKLYQGDPHALMGSKAILLIYSPNDYNTKSTAADFIFQLNLLGCEFPGHPIVEAIGSLNNFKTWQKTMPLSLMDICLEQCSKLGARLLEFSPIKRKSPYIVALHSSSNDTSNTLALWKMVKSYLSNCEIEELHLENGTVMDCNGCSFTTCLHYSKQSSCFYGGLVVKEVYPAIEKADAVVWICPNYNDAVSANISAMINRLTALYRKTSFYDKALYAVVVSGNSGSDSVAMQLLGALCINKGFYLPSRFCITATANDPGAILELDGIQELARSFALNALNTLI